MKVAILQARTSSSRLPGKVVRPILGKPMIALHVERLMRSCELDKIIVATSVEDGDDAVEEICKDIGATCYRGSLDNVLDRFYQAARKYGADQIVRLTADCPLADWDVIDQIVQKHVAGGYDFTSNTRERTYPDGLDAEALPFSLLKTAWGKSTTVFEKEHVTPYVLDRLDQLNYGQVTQAVDMGALRWTVDNFEDFELVRLIYEGLYETNPAFGTQDILNFLLDNPDVRNLNADEKAKAQYEELSKLRVRKAC